MIYNYYKFNNLYDFLSFNINNSKQIKFSIPINSHCGGIVQHFNKIEFTASCFFCNFCAFGQIKKYYLDYFEQNINNIYSENFFNGNIVDMPNSKSLLGNQYYNLEEFTSINETRNIQPWLTGIILNTSKPPCIVSEEIPIPNEFSDRDGRMDIGMVSNNNIIIFETKTTLADAMKDERFVEQYIKYQFAIEKYSCSKKYLLLIVFGGNETDLLPPSHKLCTSNIGDESKRFYNLVKTFEIKFISANALWCLSVIHMENNNIYLDEFLINLFKNNKILGLLTSGAIKIENNNYIIEPIVQILP